MQENPAHGFPETPLEVRTRVYQPHLEDEEQQVMPIAAVTFTRKQWNDFGKQ